MFSPEKRESQGGGEDKLGARRHHQPLLLGQEEEPASHSHKSILKSYFCDVGCWGSEQLIARLGITTEEFYFYFTFFN